MDRLATLSPQAVKARTFATLTQMWMNGARRRSMVIEIEIYTGSTQPPRNISPRWWSNWLVSRSSCSRPTGPGIATWMTKSYMTQIALQRLTSDDSFQVVQGSSDETDPRGSGRMILAKADGNPFFLEELARSVMEYRVPRSALVVPDTVQAVLAARIDRLPHAEKRLLQTAAVIGKDVAFPLLQAIAGLPEEELQRRLVSLQDAEFVYETSGFPELAYTFKHVLTQEVTYESLLRSTRQQIHQRIAQAIVERFPETVEVQAERLAHHYTRLALASRRLVIGNGRASTLTSARHMRKPLHISPEGSRFSTRYRRLPNVPSRNFRCRSPSVQR